MTTERDPQSAELFWLDRLLLDFREAENLEVWAALVNKSLDTSVYAWADRTWMKEAVLQFVRISKGDPPRSKDDPIPTGMLPENWPAVAVSRSKYSAEEYIAWDKANPR